MSKQGVECRMACREIYHVRVGAFSAEDLTESIWVLVFDGLNEKLGRFKEFFVIFGPKDEQVASGLHVVE